jgi:hypothetical protein
MLPNIATEKKTKNSESKPDEKEVTVRYRKCTLKEYNDQKSGNGYSDSLWNSFFDTRALNNGKQGFRFHKMFSTDGVACSVTYAREYEVKKFKRKGVDKQTQALQNAFLAKEKKQKQQQQQQQHKKDIMTLKPGIYSEKDLCLKQEQLDQIQIVSADPGAISSLTASIYDFKHHQQSIHAVKAYQSQVLSDDEVKSRQEKRKQKKTTTTTRAQEST